MGAGTAGPVIYAAAFEPPGQCFYSATWPTRIDRKEVMVGELIAVLGPLSQGNDQDRYWLRLCCEEAVINALLHGNECDPELQVEVACYRDGDDWVAVLRDEGLGFEADDVPDPSDPASLVLEHGRGILLMGQWLDELAYFEGGRCLVMRRRIS